MASTSSLCRSKKKLSELKRKIWQCNQKLLQPELDLRYTNVKCLCRPIAKKCVIRVVSDVNNPRKGRLFYTCDKCKVFFWCQPTEAKWMGNHLGQNIFPIDEGTLHLNREYELEEESDVEPGDEEVSFGGHVAQIEFGSAAEVHGRGVQEVESMRTMNKFLIRLCVGLCCILFVVVMKN